MKMKRRNFIALMGTLGATTVASSISAKPPGQTEPVHRVAIAPSIAPEPVALHPLDRALDIARRGLADCQANIRDYTAIMVKRERIDGTLSGNEYMLVKVRNRKVAGGKIVQPLSVYCHFLKPSTIKGREAIYVEGKNDGNVCAHEGGFKGKFLPTVNIAPDGALAMRGQRYPLTEIGIENLMAKLIERGESARQYPDVQCEFRKNAKVTDRSCTLLQVTQPTKQPGMEFYQAKIYIDDALNIPIRYIAYDWPRRQGDSLEVLEEYTYLNLKLNVGLTDEDFDPYNEKYNFYN